MQFLDNVMPVEVRGLPMHQREPWRGQHTLMPGTTGVSPSRAPHRPSFLLGSSTAFTQGPASYSENTAEPPVDSDGLWEPDRFLVCLLQSLVDKGLVSDFLTFSPEPRGSPHPTHPARGAHAARSPRRAWQKLLDAHY